VTAGSRPPEASSPEPTLADFQLLAHEFETPVCNEAELHRLVESVLSAPLRDKGDELEAFVSFAFGCYPRLFRDEGKRRDTMEKDRVITVFRVPGTCVDAWETTTLLVDDRNRGKKYSNGDVAVFAAQMREGRVRCGLVVAVAGITTQGTASAKGAIKTHWDRDGFIIGVVSGDDLRRLSDPDSPRCWLHTVHDALMTARHGAKYRS
jgi:hypothetical protein